MKNVMQLYTDSEWSARRAVGTESELRTTPSSSEQRARERRVRFAPIRIKLYGDVLMLSSTWTHSHFPKHSIEPYSSLAHPTAATFACKHTH